MQQNNLVISEWLKVKGVSLVGFADLHGVDAAEKQNMPYGVCIAIALNVFPSVGDTPSPAYYTEYKEVSARLKEISLELEDKIQSLGYRAVSLAREKQNRHFVTPLPFKTLATRSGLGWIGRSAVLVTREYGAAVRLNGVITDMPFQTGTPVTASFCGDCHACVDACPGRAVKGELWSVGTKRSRLLNPYKCSRTVGKRGKRIGVTDGSCGVCLAVCPWTKKYIEKRRADASAPES
ncbi:MAG TPA: epoxyqueuosine reductase [Candidatus Scubalenecus merdavium]|uniref:Epoxyqueuosine reductase n=1 Tax=Candidatus Scybalenecus merdavium TaxID=2840939 RepID=A0A9D1MTY7_9FIRM|nr:epoxyqueuosine reductase [Candidatus Scubalenecus merdavium]